MVVLPWIYKRIVSAFLAVMLFFTGGLWKDVVANPTEKIAEGADIRVVTFNLRYTGSGKTSIAYRAPLMAAQLKEIDADSMGFQEATLRWMIYLKKHLDGYDYVGVSRQDGMQIGEFSPIFYKKDKYTVVDSGTFWLSETPEKAGSKDWGSQNIRICTWAVLENKQTGERFVHLNAHFDNYGVIARSNSCDMILDKASEWGLSLSKYSSLWGHDAFFNPEIIFGIGRGANNTFEMANYPVGVENGASGSCPTQSFVDQYEYQDNGETFGSRYPGSIDLTSVDPYAGLDPRFALTVVKNGDLWPSNGSQQRAIETFAGGFNASP